MDLPWLHNNFHIKEFAQRVSLENKNTYICNRLYQRLIAKMKTKPVISKTIFISSIIITAVGCVALVCLGLRIFVLDTYPVNGSSMIPTIQPGDQIVANKLIFGARLYRNLNFLDGGSLRTLRLKGFRRINYNDVVVFNHSYPTAFDISKVYVKRCIGLPGDTIRIRDGQYHNSAVNDEAILKYFPQKSLKETPSSLLSCFPYTGGALTFKIYS